MARIEVTAYVIEAPRSLGRDQDGGVIEVAHGWRVEAATPRGDVYSYEVVLEDRDDAAHLAARVRAAGSIDPVRWAYDRPAYGSQAWLEDGGEAAERALEAEEALHPVPVYGL